MTSPALEIDEQTIARQVDALLGDPLYWFPVRHHSPAVARFVRQAMKKRKPKLVLIEGPSQASELVKHIADGKTKPPVAIYSMYRDDHNVLELAGIASAAADIPPRFAAWYPMLAYSPEYVAIKTAKELGAEVAFIDLPHYALIKKRSENEEVPPDWEHFVVESSFYARLAAAAGYKTWDEAWDAMFECGERHDDAETFRRDMALFCASIRATTPRSRIESDGTLERERFMWRSIQAAVAGREPKEVFVITGGFHLFLDRADTQAPPEPPAGTIYTTVAPYSNFRVSELSGYGAGNRAPRYYQRLWESFDHEGEPPAVAAMIEHVVAVLTRGRKDAGEGLSSADAISVTQHARMLGALRGRKIPLLDDIRDALITCCVKGSVQSEGAHLVRAMSEVEIGNAIGRVTPALGQLPLVHDFYALIEHLELGDLYGKEKRLTLTLDLREEQAAERSAFLHRLVHLEVPIGALETPPPGSAGTIFRETWKLKWTPAIEEALIEKNLYGDTVEAAATALLEEQLAGEENSAQQTTERLLRSVAMNLPAMVQRAEEACGAAIDNDRRMGSLAQALTNLILLDRHASYRKLSRTSLTELIVRSYGRAAFAVPDASSAPEEEQEEVLAGLRAIAEALLGEHGALLEKNLFVENARSGAESSTVPFLRGALLGLLAEIRAETPEQLAGHVAAFAKARPETMVTAGAFLDGVLAVSKTSILLGASALIAAIDQLLRAADWDSFLAMLPRVRHAFERLHERQRMSLCERVAENYGLKEAEAVAKLETSAGAAMHMAAIDARVAEIMKEWAF